MFMAFFGRNPNFGNNVDLEKRIERRGETSSLGQCNIDLTVLTFILY